MGVIDVICVNHNCVEDEQVYIFIQYMKYMLHMLCMLYMVELLHINIRCIYGM